jgi:hypothetical protein
MILKGRKGGGLRLARLEEESEFPNRMNRDHEYTDDPSPYCQYCGAMKKETCTCGPIADND